MEERKNLWRTRIMVGCKSTFGTPDFGDIVATAWLPEFNVPGYTGGLGLLEEIAELFALVKLKKLRNQRDIQQP